MNKKDRFIVIISAVNKPGVLNKILSLCRRRRYNIESVTAGGTHVANMYNITLVLFENKNKIHNIVNQINKIIEVVSIEAAEPKDVVDKELVLLVVQNKTVAQKLIKNKNHNASIKIINTVNKHPVLELIAEGTEINHILNNLNKKHIIKMVRSGRLALKI